MSLLAFTPASDTQVFTIGLGGIVYLLLAYFTKSSQIVIFSQNVWGYVMELFLVLLAKM